MASCLTPNACTDHAWITSLAVVMMRIFLLTGTTISLSTSIKYVFDLGAKLLMDSRVVDRVDKKLMPSPSPLR